jgi:hypothetical protein
VLSGTVRLRDNLAMTTTSEARVIVKFNDQYAAEHQAAISQGSPVCLRKWSGDLLLWVSKLENDQAPQCKCCTELTPFYLSTGESDPIFVSSDECAALAGYPST